MAMAKPPIIAKETITKALSSLLKHLHRHSQNPNPNPNANPNFFIYLILSLTKIPHNGRHLSFSLPLPHSPHHPIALLFSDRGPHPHHLPSLIQSHHLPITHLIPLSQLPFQQPLPPTAILFVDRRAAKLAAKTNHLGKKITTVVIDLSKKSWPETVGKSVGSTSLSFRGGTCCGIKVGWVGMAREEMEENVVAAVEGAVEHVPKKWRNVSGFYLKAAESVALPIYEKAVKEEESKVAA